MAEQKRHLAGTPASQGGQFAPDPKPAGDTSLVDTEQPFRDLGVTGTLQPCSNQVLYPPEGAQTLVTEAGREIVLSIHEGGLKARVTLPDTRDLWSDFTEFNAGDDVIANAMHAAAVHEHVSSQMEQRGREYELQDTYATVYSPDGPLFTSVTIREREGWIEISHYHDPDRDEVFIDQHHERLTGDDASALLDEVGAELLRDEQTWQEMFREVARGLSDDDEVEPKVREAAVRAMVSA